MSAQKGRDAVRPPQTHLETRSAAITRPKRRPRRIPPRRHRPKPPQARHADPNANADLSNLRRRAAHEHGRDRRSPPPQYFKTDFFNGIGQIQPSVTGLTLFCSRRDAPMPKQPYHHANPSTVWQVPDTFGSIYSHAAEIAARGRGAVYLRTIRRAPAFSCPP